MMKSSNKKIPPKPKKPDDSECCNRGCENCVFVYYERALKMGAKSKAPKIKRIRLKKI